MKIFQEDTIRQFLNTLNIKHLLPASALVVISIFLFSDIINLSFADNKIYIILAIIVISYFLNAFNDAILDFYSGCIPRGFWLFKITGSLERYYRKQMISIHNSIEKEYKKLIEEVEKYNDRNQKIKEELEDHDVSKKEIKSKNKEYKLNDKRIKDRYYLLNLHKELSNRLYDRFPYFDKNVQNTALGNILAASKDTLYFKYEIDNFILIHHLRPILEKSGISHYEQKEKNTMDLMLNLSLICIILFFEYLFYFGVINAKIKFLIVGFFLALLSYTFYHASISAAKQWERMVRVGFDLYRFELMEKLNFYFSRDFITLKDEMNIWKSYIKFNEYNPHINKQTENDFPYFNYDFFKKGKSKE